MFSANEKAQFIYSVVKELTLLLQRLSLYQSKILAKLKVFANNKFNVA